MTTDAKTQRLRRVFRWACYWLILQGVLNLLLNETLAIWLRLRYQQTLMPYARQAAVAQLCLALLLQRAVLDPRRQALAVDVLLLAFIAQVYLALSFRLSVDALVPYEWLSLLINATLAGLLIRNRTRSSQMEGEIALVSEPAMQWFKQVSQQAGQLVAATKDRSKASSLSYAVKPLAPEAEVETPAPQKATAPDPKSTSLPHMD